MFRNYLKIAWRSLLKNRVYSVLNILGLAIGLSCFLLIVMYVVDELSYDRFHEKADRIYRVNSDIKFGDSQLNLPLSSDMMGASLKQDYPQVEEYVRIYNSNGSKMIRKGTEFLHEDKVAHADSGFFRVFSLPLIAGDPNTALNDPNSVVISETMAQKYFGTTDVLGKVIETMEGETYGITAVYKDIPPNSHFQFDFVFSMDNVAYDWGNYLSHNFHTYLLLQEGTSAKEFEAGFDQYLNRYVLPQAKQLMNIGSMQEFKDAGNKLEYSLMPLSRIHLHSDRSFEFTAGGNIQYVYIFSAVALFILLIACVNFMNLATARSADRAREVGIRKVLGSVRRQLILQFLTEAILMAFLALLIAFMIAYAVLPYFNELSAKSLSLQRIFQPDVILFLLALPFVVGVLAGSYPAFFLSAFKPIQVLKGRLTLGASGGTFRNVLVVFQFAISIILIICTLIVYQQLNYIQTKNLGFNKEQVLIINDTHALGGHAETFKQEVLQLPGVQSGTLSGFLPVSSSSRSDQTFSKETVIDSRNGFGMQTWYIDHDYLNTLGMELLAGRNFSREMASDSSALIINESTASFLGYDDPIGQNLYRVDNYQTGEVRPYKIIGVVKNFHYESLRQNVGPLSFLLGKSAWLASFKVDAARIPALLAGVKQKWNAVAPGIPFSYRFLDESFDEMYRTEQRVSQLALAFSALAIIVACLGLFGLATFMAEKRAKEIGIRKILGAPVQSLLELLSKDFIKLVVLAFVIATPVAWYAMRQWLNNFAFRVEISWWVFVMAGGLALFIALATVSVQAMKAALRNPVKNLRTE